ncbi:MAG TPA: PilZ domain-containing protein [Dissulfurispiraceae bacterium]|nr:PilZ domain-containing protein [Dissulfurispiraceae bacterium]
MQERREFFRIDVDVPVFIRVPAGGEAGDCACTLSKEKFSDDIKKSLVRRINISGAGISFLSDKQYSAGDLIEMLVMIENVYPGIITLCTRVLRSEKRRNKYFTAVEYIGMTTEIRELISAFVFQLQRTLIQEKRVGWL